MTAADLDRLRRKASQGESISREESASLIKSLSYEEKLQLRNAIRAMRDPIASTRSYMTHKNHF